MIKLDNVSVIHPKGQPLLKNVTLQFGKGKLHVIIGPNGSGKTTLLKTMAALIPATEGQISISGKTPRGASASWLAGELSFIESEHLAPFAYTVADTIMWGRWHHHQGFPRTEDHTRAVAAAEIMGIRHLTDRSVTTLSLGERKKAHLARSLASGVSSLLWDEPCAPLDIRATLELLNLARQRAREGATVIISLHDIPLALRYADTITVLERGGARWHGSPDRPECMDIIQKTFGVNLTQGQPTLDPLPMPQTSR